MTYYAVKVGKQPGIYKTWAECKENTFEFPGATFKKFDTEQEAIDFMNEKEEAIDDGGRSFDNLSLKDIDVRNDIKNKIIHAFVDGSQISERGKKKNLQPLYGVIILQNNPLREGTNDLLATMMTGSVKSMPGVADITVSNQIAGELYSALQATRWAVSMGMKEINIYYDFKGIEEWALGTWDVKYDLPISYKKTMDELRTKIKVNFIKTKGHNDVMYNEVVDMVAKAGKWLD